MKDILLYQTQEMLENFIEAEHNGAIQITDVSMEDNSYNNDDEERSLDITIDYVPAEIGENQVEPTATIEIDTKSLAEAVIKNIEKNSKIRDRLGNIISH